MLAENRIKKKQMASKNIFFVSIQNFGVKNVIFLLKEGGVTSFHFKPCFVKSTLNFPKYLRSGTFSSPVTTKMLFRHTFCSVRQNVLQILDQCLKTFNLSYEPHLYVLFQHLSL